MNPRIKRLRSIASAFAVIAVASLVSTPAIAASLTWDSSGAGGNNPTDGSGTWSTTGTNWANSGADSPWTTGNNAVIGNGGTAGTVTVSGGVSVGNITFNPVASGTFYTIAGSTVTLTSGTIAVNSAGAVINSVIDGSVGLVKSGTGMLTLTGPDTYTGLTTISSGTLALNGGDNRLATSGTVSFSGASTLNIANNQSLANLAIAVGSNITGTVTGAGTLTATGGTLLVGGSVTNATSAQALTMSGLTGFVYNNNAGIFTVSGQNLGTASNPENSTATLSLAQTSTITASQFNVGHFGANGTNIGIVNLGQTTTINADAIGIADIGHCDGTLQFQSSLTNPMLTIRGSAGGSSRAATMIIGVNGSASGYLGKVDLTTGVTTSSTLDAMIGTLTIGDNNRGGTAGGTLGAAGSFAMGSGTLDVTNLILGTDTAGTSASGACTSTGTFTLGVTGGIAGGTVKVQTLTLASKLSSGADVVTGVFNLNNGGTLAAQTIQPGSFGGGNAAVRTINWNDGTIENYDASTDLTISSGLTTFALLGAGNHTFDIGTGRTGTVAQVMSNTGALTKADSGTLILTAANTYTGTTTISGGILVAGTNALSSANGAFGNASSAIILGDSNTTANNSSPSLVTGGAFTVGRPVTIANQTTSGTYGIGGNTDNNSTFSGVITANQSFNVTQATTTGAHALTISTSIVSGIAGTQTVNFANTGAVIVSGSIGSGPGTLAVTQSGPGTTTLSGSNTYTGATNVNAGILIVQGSISGSQVNVAGGTLAGIGSVVGNVIVGTGSGAASSSIFAPSGGGGSLGSNLSITGSLVLNSDAAYQFKINSDESGVNDYFQATGTLTLATGATLTGFDLGAGVSPTDIGDTYAIAYASNITGTFANAPESLGNPSLYFKIGNDSYAVDYSGTQIDLTLEAVPEPGTWATVLCGFGMLIGIQRFRRKS